MARFKERLIMNPFNITRQAGRKVLALILILGGLTGLACTATASSTSKLEQAADGQTVYFNAWGGSPNINSYIGWVAEQVKARYGITLEHVKLTDTAEAVSRILAEKVAGKNTGGSVDLMGYCEPMRGHLICQPLILPILRHCPGW